MAAKEQRRTQAIVLSRLAYGESDWIVTFCSLGYGKIKGIAKGARRSQRRFANALEPMSMVDLIFCRRRPGGLALIEGCDVLSHFSRIRSDLGKTMLAAYLLDLTDKFLTEERTNESVFELLAAFLNLFESGAANEAMLRFFEVRLLKIAGYSPLFDQCLGCKAALGSHRSYFFSPVDGGLVCPDCSRSFPEAMPISLGTIKTLLLARDTAVERVARIALTEQGRQESRRLLSRFIHHLLGKEPKSMQVLEEMRGFDDTGLPNTC